MDLSLYLQFYVWVNLWGYNKICQSHSNLFIFCALWDFRNWVCYGKKDCLFLLCVWFWRSSFMVNFLFFFFFLIDLHKFFTIKCVHFSQLNLFLFGFLFCNFLLVMTSVHTIRLITSVQS